MNKSSDKTFFARRCDFCYYYVLVDVRRDGNYYYNEEDKEYGKKD